MDELLLADYLRILKTKARLCLIVGSLILILSLIFALSWKNYSAVATIEIAQPEVPQDIIASNKGSAREAIQNLADLRVNRLLQKVASTGSLVEIITKFDLYAKERETKPIALLAEKMRAKIKIAFLSGSSKQRPNGGDDPIAFTLAFSYADPVVAQRVTNEIVSRFLDEDMKEHRTQSQEVAAFLESQLKSLDASLVEQEKQIADFRAQNGDVRPEALAFNQQTSASLAMSLQNLESQITTNLGTQGALRAQLASLDPYARVVGDDRQVLSTPSTLLRGMKSEYATLKAKYGPQHPDVVKLSRQIETLEAETGKSVGTDTGSLKARLTDVQTQLAAARKTYGAENPTIQSLEKQEKSLTEQIAAAGKAKAPAATEAQDADNPAYLNVRTQLQTTEQQYKALNDQKKALMDQLQKYRDAVVQNPEAEKKLASLTRDYDNAQMRYRELKAKKMEADMQQTVEQDRTGERLVILNPPEMPLKTTPARILFVLAGVIASVAAGAAAALASYFAAPTIASPAHFEALTGTAPMALIPTMISENERILISPKTTKKPALIALGALVVLTIVVSLFVPLDVLWASVLQRLGVY